MALNGAVGPVQRVEIDGTSTVLGAAVSGRMYRLITAVFGAAAAGENFKFTSGGTDLTGNTVNTVGDVVILPPNEFGWIDGTDGADLTLVGSGALDGWAIVQTIRTNQTTPGYTPHAP